LWIFWAVVTIYRKQAMTLPWSEDYTWQSPIGTQQMTTILHDMFRAGLRCVFLAAFQSTAAIISQSNLVACSQSVVGHVRSSQHSSCLTYCCQPWLWLDHMHRGVDKTPQTSRVMSYIMAHAPGTTAKMWRRAMYGYLAHGVTMINLYEFRPCTAAYTENYVDDGWGLYGSVRTALSELTAFEDIVQGGRVAYGDVGIWNSEVMDIWGPVIPPIATSFPGVTVQRHFNIKVSSSMKHFNIKVSPQNVLSLIKNASATAHRALQHLAGCQASAVHCAAALRAGRGHGCRS
jgi:hypothetical protein